MQFKSTNGNSNLKHTFSFVVQRSLQSNGFGVVVSPLSGAAFLQSVGEAPSSQVCWAASKYMLSGQGRENAWPLAHCRKPAQPKGPLGSGRSSGKSHADPREALPRRAIIVAVRMFLILMLSIDGLFGNCLLLLSLSPCPEWTSVHVEMDLLFLR